MISIWSVTNYHQPQITILLQQTTLWQQYMLQVFGPHTTISWTWLDWCRLLYSIIWKPGEVFSNSLLSSSEILPWLFSHYEPLILILDKEHYNTIFFIIVRLESKNKSIKVIFSAKSSHNSRMPNVNKIRFHALTFRTDVRIKGEATYKTWPNHTWRRVWKCYDVQNKSNS